MSKTAREVIADTMIARTEGKMSTLETVQDFIGDDSAATVITALDAAGFVIVPKEPTDEMIKLAADVLADIGGDCASESLAADCYRAMIDPFSPEHPY